MVVVAKNEALWWGLAMAWNEHIKLFVSLLNAISIGVLGVGVIGPLTQPKNPFYGWYSGPSGMDKALAEKFLVDPPSVFSVLRWDLILYALIVHGLAQLLLRLLRDE